MKIDRRKVRKVALKFLCWYWIVFIIYLIMSREPAYFASPKVKGVVAYVHHNEYHWRGRSGDRIEPVIHYNVGDSTYEYDNRYGSYMRSFETGDSVTMVYSKSHPENAALVSLIGYWATTDELMFSFLCCGLVISLIYALYTPRIDGGDTESGEENGDDEEEFVILPSN